MRVSNAIARAWLAAVLTAIFPIGCGPSTSGPESMEQLKIAQVGQLFHIFQKGAKPPPQGIKDIESMRSNLTAAVASIRSKEVLVYWGTGFSDAPEAASTVLAYHRDVPEKGGEVLMQNGKARKMTAEEFKAAPKPGGATTEDKTAAAKSSGNKK
jgi:hypothetical protein